MIKLKEFNNQQELFDFVVEHFNKQGIRAVGWVALSESCVYRTQTGKSCAIGCLIDDKDYSDFYENKGLRQLVDARLIEEPVHYSLLKDLQHAHDGNATFEGMYIKFGLIADGYGLNKNKLKDNPYD